MIIAGELVWGRKPLSYWSYLHATGGDLRAAITRYAGTTVALLATAALIWRGDFMVATVLAAIHIYASPIVAAHLVPRTELIAATSH